MFPNVGHMISHYKTNNEIRIDEYKVATRTLLIQPTCGSFTDQHLSVCVFRSFLHLGAGLSVGLSGLAAGFAIGIVGDAGVRGTAQQPRLFVGMILILIFAEVLGLYGLIVALILSTK